MSSYMYFYIRSKDDELIPFLHMSRVNSLYNYLEKKVPYEKVAILHKKDVANALVQIKDGIDSYQKTITTAQNKIKEIGSWNNSIQEKIEIIHDYEEIISNAKEHIEDEEWSYHIARVLDVIINQTSAPRIYASIENGFATVEDIIDDSFS